MAGFNKKISSYISWSESFRSNGQPQVTVHQSEHMEMPARMATVFIEKWGMVAGMSDGEDSAGRHKVRLATPDEVVDRACEMATLAMASFAEREWLTDVPTLQEAKEILQAKDDDTKEQS